MIVLKIIGWTIVVALIVYILKLGFSEGCKLIVGDKVLIKLLIKMLLAMAVVILMVSLLNQPFTLTGITHAWMMAKSYVRVFLIPCMFLMVIDTLVIFTNIKRSLERE